MLTVRRMITYLEAHGWPAIRERGEPVWFKDPLGFAGNRMRAREAYELQKRREDNGIATQSRSETTGEKNEPQVDRRRSA